MEPILSEANTRFCLFPIQYNDLYKHYKKMEEVMWAAQKLDFSRDLSDFKSCLNEKQQHVVKSFIALITSFDGILNEGLGDCFLSEVTYLEAKMLYGLQFHIENVHNETYSLMAEAIIEDPVERDIYLNAVVNFESIAKLKNWFFKYMKPEVSFATKIVVQAFFEGVILMSLFPIPYQIKKIVANNKLPGFIRGNEYVFRDETYHKHSGVLIYTRYIQNKLSDEAMVNIADEVAGLVCGLLNELFNVSLIGLNPALLEEHSLYLISDLLTQLGVNSEKYSVKSTPITFMNSVELDDNPSFFEVEVTNYRDNDINNEAKSVKYEDNDDF